MEEITVGDFTFRLIKKIFITRWDRTFAHIESKPRGQAEYTTEFACYMSNSEVGIWRLCVFNNPEVHCKTSSSEISFYKGEDYIQGTLICMELQQLINTTSITSFHAKCKKDSPQEFINDFSWLFSQSTEVNKEYIGSHDRYLIIPGLHTEDENPTSETIEEARQMPFDLTYGTIHTEDEISQEITRISGKLFNLYSKGEEVVHARHNNSFEEVLNISGNICSITLTSKKDSSMLTLYYLKATIKMLDDAYIMPKYKKTVAKISAISFHISIMPIALIPQTYAVDKFGLYTTFVPMGFYIFKLFEYSSQLSEDENKKYQVTRDFTYIGDRSMNIFPFETYTPEVTEQETQHEPNTSDKPEKRIKIENVGGKKTRIKQKEKKRKTTRKRKYKYKK